jgi:hypothetical protein
MALGFDARRKKQSHQLVAGTCISGEIQEQSGNEAVETFFFLGPSTFLLLTSTKLEPLLTRVPYNAAEDG